MKWIKSECAVFEVESDDCEEIQIGDIKRVLCRSCVVDIHNFMASRQSFTRRLKEDLEEAKK